MLAENFNYLKGINIINLLPYIQKNTFCCMQMFASKCSVVKRVPEETQKRYYILLLKLISGKH